MQIETYPNKSDASRAAASGGANLLRKAISERGQAHVVVATGASQIDMLAALITEDVDWVKVTGFHLDEYLGLPITHRASFRGYLKERFVDRVPLRGFHYIDGEAEPTAECERLGTAIRGVDIDVAFIGIGENGHLAFNDPPADFETDEAYIVVELDQACRQQQVGEGWFAGIDDVPTHAISMSIRQILRARAIACTVPDERKANAVKQAVTGPVTPLVPASILQQHASTTLFLDRPAASLLDQ